MFSLEGSYGKYSQPLIETKLPMYFAVDFNTIQQVYEHQKKFPIFKYSHIDIYLIHIYNLTGKLS